VALRPGADPALLAFLVRHVLAHGAAADELARCADPAGVERLRQLVAPYDAERAAAICDVEPGVLHELADLVAGAGRVAIETGTGVSMSRSANLTEWLVWALSAVTGSLDRPGGATFNPGFLRPMEDALPGGRGDLLPRAPSRPDVPRIVNGEMPCAVLADEIAAGRIRALFVRVGNPAMAIPGTAAVADALSRLELLVAIDARSTATTELATHVLPMTDHLERADLVTGYLQATPFMRYAPAIVARRAERRPQWWVFAELSRRLELPLFGSKRADAQVAEAVGAGGELDDELVAATLARSARRPWAEVREAPYGVLDESLPPGWLVPDRLPRPLDLAPAPLVEVFEGPWAGRLAGTAAAGGAAADVDAVGRPGTAGLVLVNRRSGGQYNSFSPRRADAGPARPTLFVHPDDAARRGLSDGDRAELSTAAGSCVAVVEVTDRTRAGVVSLPHAHALANVNALTSTHDVDPLNGMPILSGLAVTLSGPCLD
jgi:anaerobic selenocysteine-containing dehydrogenase